MAYGFLNTGLENVPSSWCRIRGRKCSLEIEKVTKPVLDNLDVNVAMTTTDAEISDMLKDEIKHLSPRTKKRCCTVIHTSWHYTTLGAFLVVFLGCE